MVTRLYTNGFQTYHPSPPSAALATWTSTVSSGSFGLSGVTNDADMGGTNSVTQASGSVNPTSKVCKRFYSPPLQAQIIPSGTIKGQFFCNQTGATDNAQLAFALIIVKPDGTARTIWLDVTSSDDNATAPPEMAVTTPTNRKLRDTSENVSIPLTSVTVEGGDILSLEVGFKAFSTTNQNITVSFGARTVPDTSTVADNPENDTATTEGAAWVEFSQDIMFQEPFYVRSSNIPVHAATPTNATATITLTPPTSMRQGDLVVVHCESRSSATWTNGVTGGQTWTTEAAYQGTGGPFLRVFWCIFNGTWGASPRFDSTSSVCTSAVMNVFRGRTTDEVWLQDVAQAAVEVAAAATITISGFSFTGNAKCGVALEVWATVDDNSWGGHGDLNWFIGDGSYFKNTSGSDQSMAIAFFISRTSGEATGDNTATQTALGNDTTETWRMAWRCLDFNILNMPPMQPPSLGKG